MFTTQELDNGARILLAPQQDTQAVTVLALFPVGSRYEPLGLNGASHFIEHLMFKGTSRRPTTLHISRELDRVGAEHNAFTGKDYTGYYIKVNAEHLDLALDTLADMLFHSTFKAQEIERERKVVIEEIHLYEDNPSRNLDDVFEGLLYRGHPLGRLISGTRDSMVKMRRAPLVAYRDRFYRPDQLVLTVAGNLGEHPMDRIGATFGRETSHRRARIRPQPFRRTPRGPAVRIHWKETTQVHLALGVPAFGVNDARAYPLAILANVLGGTMSSRLFIAVRERLGLAYTVHASADAYADTGSFCVTAGLDPARLTQAIRVILRELQRVRERGITTDELSRAKENIEGRIVLGLEESSARADWYGKQALLKDEILTPEQRIARLMAVERSAVGAVGHELLRTDRLHLAIIGAYKDEAPFKKFLKFS